MSDKDLREAIRKIIEKELKGVGELLPKDMIFNAATKIGPEIEKIIERGGYVKKSKFDNLENIIKGLEARIAELEKN